MGPRAIESRTLAEKAYREIKEAIQRNEFLPGQELPIGALAETLGISHTPVREALTVLRNEGLIEHEPNHKPRVSRIAAGDVEEIYQVRRLLEPQVALMVAEALQADASLRERILILRDKTASLCRGDRREHNKEDYLAIDLELNEIMLAAIRNRLLREIVNLVEDRSLRTRTFVEASSKPSHSEAHVQAAREHLQIIDALLSGDAAAITTAVIAHLHNAEKRTLRVLREMGDNKVAA